MNTTRRPVVLISDGDAADAFALAEAAQQAGLQVVTDTHGRVVELALRYHPDLIVLNVQQMAGEGLDQLAELRENATTRPIRVLATAVIEDDFARSVCEELGAVAFVTKPLQSTFVSSVVSLSAVRL